MIAIIDYGAGNLESVLKAFRFIGCEASLVTDPNELCRADAAVLPGVGAFGDAMENLRESGMIPAVRAFLSAEKPFLGICLGLQMLFEESEEAPGVEGLSLLPGKILRIPAAEGLKIPHMGWNSLACSPSPLFHGLPLEAYVYFVHSYYLKAENRADVIATAAYGVEIDAAVQRGKLFAAQFHPEKSGRTGLEMLRNFAGLIGEGN